MRHASIFALLMLSLTSCATAGGDAPGTGADADPNAPRPDADPSAPDADPSNPPPDANVSNPPPDAMVAPMECTLVAPQTGCPAGEACDLDDTMLATGGTECRPVTAMGTETSTCAGVTACAAGYTCLGGAGTSQCFKFCSTDSNCSPTAGGLCTIDIVYGAPPMEVPGATVCSKACDPLNSSGCPSSFGCHVYQEPPGTAERFFTHCSPSGAGGQEATCTDDTSCQANYSCVQINMTTNKCLKNCNVSTNTGCAGLPAGNSCVGFSEPAVVGGFEYGVCFDGT